MRHRANPRFWQYYGHLPEEIRRLADDSYKLLRENPKHPSLHFKKVGRFWSVRIGIHYRALAVEEKPDIVWFWVGLHTEYVRLLRES